MEGGEEEKKSELTHRQVTTTCNPENLNEILQTLLHVPIFCCQKKSHAQQEHDNFPLQANAYVAYVN